MTVGLEPHNLVVLLNQDSPQSCYLGTGVIQLVLQTLHEEQSVRARLLVILLLAIKFPHDT